MKVTYHILAIILKDFLKCIDNARPPEPRIQNTRRTLGRLQLHELQTCIESQVQYIIIQHQHSDHCRRHISTCISKSTPSPGKLCTACHQAANMVTISTFSRGEYGHLLGASRSSPILFLVNVFTFLLPLPLYMVNCAGAGP